MKFSVTVQGNGNLLIQVTA